jgi:hypothetical protein
MNKIDQKLGNPVKESVILVTICKITCTPALQFAPLPKN